MNAGGFQDDDSENPAAPSAQRVYKVSSGPYPAFPRLPVYGASSNLALTQIALELDTALKASSYRERPSSFSDIDRAYGLVREPQPSVQQHLAAQRDLFPLELLRKKNPGPRRDKEQVQKPAEADDDDLRALVPKLEAEDDPEEEDGEEQEEDPLLELELEESDSDNDYTTNYDDEEPADDFDEDNEDAI